jgi:hypothetical protein
VKVLDNTGLMGIQASCEPGQAQKMLDVMCGGLTPDCYVTLLFCYFKLCGLYVYVNSTTRA